MSVINSFIANLKLSAPPASSGSESISGLGDTLVFLRTVGTVPDNITGVSFYVASVTPSSGTISINSSSPLQEGDSVGFGYVPGNASALEDLISGKVNNPSLQASAGATVTVDVQYYARDISPVTGTPVINLVSAVVENTNPDQVVLTYDSPLSATAPSAAAYTVPGKTVTGVNISGSTVEITVDNDFVESDTPTITYIVPATNPVTGANTAIAEALSAQAVVNNVRDILFQEQRIFAAGESGYPRFRGPALVQAANGDILAFANARQLLDLDPSDIVMKRSTDGGATWGSLATIVPETLPNNATSNSKISPVLCTATGNIFLFYTEDFDKILYRSSSDNGLTWGSVVNVTSAVTPSSLPASTRVRPSPSSAIEIKNGLFAGRLIVPCHGTEPDGDDRAFYPYSDDNGATWQAPTGFTDGAESSITEMPDGSLMHIGRNSDKIGSAPFRKLVSFSSDGGDTWSASVLEDDLTDPIVNQACILMSDDLNAAVISASDPVFRYSMLLQLTQDGVTYGESRYIYKNNAGYPGMIPLPNKEIALLYEKEHNYFIQELFFVKTNQAWIEDPTKDNTIGPSDVIPTTTDGDFVTYRAHIEEPATTKDIATAFPGFDESGQVQGYFGTTANFYSDNDASSQVLLDDFSGLGIPSSPVDVAVEIAIKIFADPAPAASLYPFRVIFRRDNKRAWWRIRDGNIEARNSGGTFDVIGPVTVNLYDWMIFRTEIDDTNSTVRLYLDNNLLGSWPVLVAPGPDTFLLRCLGSAASPAGFSISYAKVSSI